MYSRDCNKLIHVLDTIQILTKKMVFFFSERFRIFFAMFANCNHSGNNIASKSVAHRLHRDN